MVTPSMPLKTAMPSVLRISAPAPLARTRGTTPRMKAKDVMRIGRSRKRQASTVASTRPLPLSWSCLANSTIRIAFLAASPISTTKPIWVKMLLSIRASQTPVMAANKHIGTMRMIDRGNDQLSYWAERTRRTNTTANGKASLVRMSVEARIC